MLRMPRLIRRFSLTLVAALGAAGSIRAQTAPIRPPAVPLVTHNPYFSIWSFTDSPQADWTRHWTGRTNGMCSMIRIDEKAYRLMGRTPESIPALQQMSMDVSATRTVYTFAGAGLH